MYYLIRRVDEALLLHKYDKNKISLSEHKDTQAMIGFLIHHRYMPKTEEECAQALAEYDQKLKTEILVFQDLPQDILDTVNDLEELYFGIMTKETYKKLKAFYRKHKKILKGV